MMFRAQQVRHTLVHCLLLSSTSCRGERTQSMLHPAGPGAEHIASLWWVLLTVCALVFVLFILLLGVALLRSRPKHPQPPFGDTRFVAVFGIFIPAVALFFLLFSSLYSTVTLKKEKPIFTIEVTGHMWWWEVRYPEHNIVTANELYIPVGTPVELKLHSQDVIHSFWVPELDGKVDVLPDITNTLTISARSVGSYRGQCAEFCGVQHAHMAFWVKAVEPTTFEDWVTERQSASEPPTSNLALQGQQVFFAAGCDSCHAIRGTQAVGDAGPDLTHLSSRSMIGAGVATNNRANLAGWLLDPQSLKPGNKMPRTFLNSEDLHALVHYLEGLK